MIICEIGLNHLGDEQYANNYVSNILSNNVDAITIQVRESDFYVNDYKNFILSDDFYYKLIKKVKNSKVKIGIALSEAIEEKRINDGDIVVLASFGAGWYWGSVIIKC